MGNESQGNRLKCSGALRWVGVLMMVGAPVGLIGDVARWWSSEEFGSWLAIFAIGLLLLLRPGSITDLIPMISALKDDIRSIKGTTENQEHEIRSIREQVLHFQLYLSRISSNPQATAKVVFGTERRAIGEVLSGGREEEEEERVLKEKGLTKKVKPQARSWYLPLSQR